MAREKGLFKDDDRFSATHDAMSDWFANRANQFGFLRYVMCSQPTHWKGELERPIVSKTGFLYGFADLVITFDDHFGSTRTILAEFKSTIRDKPSILRQINAYQSQLPMVDYRVLVYNDEAVSEARSFEWASFFAGQNIFLFSLEDIGTIIRDHSEIANGLSSGDTYQDLPYPVGIWPAYNLNHTEDFHYISMEIEYEDFQKHKKIIYPDVVDLKSAQAEGLRNVLERCPHPQIRVKTSIAPDGERGAHTSISSLECDGEMIITAQQNKD